MKIKKILGGILIAAFTGIPALVLAVDAGLGGTPGATGGTQFVNPIKADTFSELVALVITTAVNILIPFVVLAFIYSGFLFVKAQGKEKELEEAKTAIKWSVIGAFILFGAAGFAQLISQTLSAVTK